ncbi:MAG TPA: homoserine kinase [Dehalococcoidia bacterium]|nr:homoserine kinase [Dehalococcoidia bacterium]
MNPVRVLAPATTANLGPGFDCLGMSVDLWNRLDVLPAGSDRNTPLVEVIGEGAGELPIDNGNLVYQAMEFLFREADESLPPLRLICHNQVPLSRGLGSSAAAIASGLVAANALCRHSFPPNELLEMAATIEGHPDNVAAAILGGLRLVISDQNRLYTVPISVPSEVHAVLLVPEVRIATEDARRVLPDLVSVADAVYNLGRIALLVAGMTTNHPEYLRVATQDRLHQPYRQAIFPEMRLIFKAARDAGALGVFLSGSGSTIMALTQGREMTVAYEMAEAARQAELEYRVEVTKPTLLGAHLVDAD